MTDEPDADSAGNAHTDDTGDSTPEAAADDPATVRVRGIYTTAITHLLSESEGFAVVDASPPIRERFDESFPTEQADATIATTDDRQGIGVSGREGAVERTVARVRAVGRDALTWTDPAPRGAVFAGAVTETLGGGAIVDLGEREGFLPYSKTARRIGESDRLCVQVNEESAPWTSGRPVLDTETRVQGSLATLVRNGEADGGPGAGTGVGTGAPELADLLPEEPPEDWSVEWERGADDADLDALGETLASLSERATALDDAFAGAESPEDVAPETYWSGTATTWVWFGRESRFGLDERRRAVVPTMAGHHRIKAGDERASAAVDFAEAVYPDADGELPFDAVTRQFGPGKGDAVRLDHGKPDGRLITLGEAEVAERDSDGTVVLHREMSPGGAYDGLGVERRQGDVAVTKITEGRWWYPTVYRSADGERRGTYVNVCTPVEVFPDAVRYVDLHVDVVKRVDGTVERVDDDELDAAVEAGHVPETLAEKARSVAAAVENAL